MKFLQNIPPYLFFTGKGGVGKTSISCATAIHLAEQGKRVLLVSTDPASNVGQVFNQTIGNAITPVTAVPDLSALEIDPQQAAEQYRARIVDPIKGLLPEEVVNSIREQLSGACTTEIAAFDEFTGLLTDASLLARFDHIIFDTAPTGTQKHLKNYITKKRLRWNRLRMLLFIGKRPQLQSIVKSGC